MADNELNVQVSDDGYEASLKEAIRLNKELESQLFKTANILKSNNAEYRSAYTQLAKYVNAINNLNAKINQGGNQSKTKDKPKQNDFNKNLSSTIKLNKQLENQLNRTASAMRSATDGYGKAANKLKDLNSELRSLHDNLGGKTNMNVNVNRVAGNSSGGVNPNINPQTPNTPVDDTNNTGKKKGIFGKISSFGSKAFNFVSDKLSGPLGNMIGSTRLGSALNVTQFNKLTKMIGPIGGLLALLTAVVKLGLTGLKDRVANIQGKLAMGESNAFTESTVNSMNSLNKVSTKIKQTFEGLRSAAANLITAFTGLIDSASKSIESLDEWLGKAIYKLGHGGSEEGYESYHDSELAKNNVTGNELSEVENLIGTEGRKLGFDNTSINEMQKTIIERSAQLAKDKGASTYDMAKTVINDIFSGNQDLAQYGIVVDDDVLAGWAALKKGIDIVNVSYSDAALAGLRYELVLEQMSKVGNKGLQDTIKKLKEQGALMQKNKNNVSEFEEVLKISGYNEGIPDIVGDMVIGIGDADKGISRLRDKIQNLNGYELEFVYSIFGENIPEWVEKALKKSHDGVLEYFIKLGVVADEDDLLSYAKMLQYNEAAPTVLEVYAKYGGFTNMDEMEQAFYELSDHEFELMVKLNGIDNLEDLRDFVRELSWEDLAGLQGQLDDVTYNRLVAMKNKIEELDESSGMTMSNIGRLIAGFAAQIGKVFIDPINSIWAIAKALICLTSGDFSGALEALGVASSNSKQLESDINSIGNDILSSAYDTNGRIAYKSTSEYRDMQAYNSGGVSFDNSDAAAQSNNNPNGYISISNLIGHADGGISTSFHIAGISEGNKPEAIIPLSSSAANPAYEQIGRAVAMTMGGMNNSLSGGQTIINVAPNSTVIGDQAGLRKLAALIESNIALLKRDRGELDYGINK